jgi:hypothetical protein
MEDTHSAPRPSVEATAIELVRQLHTKYDADAVERARVATQLAAQRAELAALREQVRRLESAIALAIGDPAAAIEAEG